MKSASKSFDLRLPSLLSMTTLLNASMKFESALFVSFVASSRRLKSEKNRSLSLGSTMSLFSQSFSQFLFKIIFSIITPYSSGILACIKIPFSIVSRLTCVLSSGLLSLKLLNDDSTSCRSASKSWGLTFALSKICARDAIAELIGRLF